MTKLGFTTRQVHADRMLNTPEHGGVHSSTSNSVLFEFKDAQGIIDAFQGKRAAHVYSRSSSPSVAALQNMLCELEGGVGALCYATGMAAISSTLFALLKSGYMLQLFMKERNNLDVTSVMLALEKRAK